MLRTASGYARALARSDMLKSRLIVKQWDKRGQEGVRRQIGLKQHARCSSFDERFGVFPLMVICGLRKRDKQRRFACGGEFRDGTGSAAREHKIGLALPNKEELPRPIKIQPALCAEKTERKRRDALHQARQVRFGGNYQNVPFAWQYSWIGKP